MKGIVLAGGSGTRLFPSSYSVSKQLLPIYDKPTIYYPISILMLSGIREILIISTPRDLPMIENLLGSGNQFGLNFTYKVQQHPKGIAEAFLIGKQFINDSPVSLILGDNLFYGHEMTELLSEASSQKKGATIFAYHVNNPEAYGIVDFNDKGQAVSINEKPLAPRSNWAITGLYFYDSKVIEFAERLKPSNRGELEISDINRMYLESNQLRVQCMGRGFAWLDTGTHESLLASGQFVQTIEERQGLKIACLEEIALLKGFISKDDLASLIDKYPKSSYTQYIQKLLHYE